MSENTNKTVGLENITCLIVDDDKFSRTFIKNALYQIGIHNIKEAADAGEASELVKEFAIDIILLDQQMPDKSGLEFVKELKNAVGSIRNIPIIMITVDAQEKTVLEAKELGVRDYLIKPVSPMTLKKRICNTLGVKQERV